MDWHMRADAAGKLSFLHVKVASFYSRRTQVVSQIELCDGFCPYNLRRESVKGLPESSC
jgi:hypothetical protein